MAANTRTHARTLYLVFWILRPVEEIQFLRVKALHCGILRSAEWRKHMEKRADSEYGHISWQALCKRQGNESEWRGADTVLIVYAACSFHLLEQMMAPSYKGIAPQARSRLYRYRVQRWQRGCRNGTATRLDENALRRTRFFLFCPIIEHHRIFYNSACCMPRHIVYTRRRIILISFAPRKGGGWLLIVYKPILSGLLKFSAEMQ